MGFIRNLFSNIGKNRPDSLDFVEEYWEADFSRVRERRFQPEHGPRYSSAFIGDALCLELEKESFFAWVDDPLYRYTDFVLDCEIGFDAGNGHSAAGIVFRRDSDNTFYYCLCSSKGHVRADVVFNGKPMPLFGWTEVIDWETAETGVSLRIVAHGSTFLFCVNEVTVAEIEDDTIGSGGIAFAGQNYTEAPTARFYLRELAVESRPYHVEAQFVRWSVLLPIPFAQRIAFADSLYQTGHQNTAAVQLRKASLQGELSLSQQLRLGECLLRLGLYDMAESSAVRITEKEPDSIDGILLLLDIFYRQNRLFEAKKLIEERLTVLDNNPLVWNIWGNIEYGLGNTKSAAEKYEQACSLDGDIPMYAINAARCFLRLGDMEKALGMFEKAAAGLFRGEEYEELQLILREMEEIDPDYAAVHAFRGKIAFHAGDFDESARLFNLLLNRDEADASVCYLSGMLRVRENKRDRALPLFEKAADLEAGFYLNWFRLAETREALGLDPGPALHRALDLQPEDPWVYNFAGLLKLEAGKAADALGFFHQARKLAPEQHEIRINLSQALIDTGAYREAEELLLEGNVKSPPVLNQLGNLYAALQKFEPAAERYEECLDAEPENTAYLENAAAVYLELEEIPRAEELLRRALELEERASLYNLMGYTALKLGEYARARTAYETALSLEPANDIVRYQLAELLFSMGQFESARTILREGPGLAESEKGAALLVKISHRLEIEYSCAECGRTWRVPRDIPGQGKLVLKGDPSEESPAGECPGCGTVYCVACAKQHLIHDRFTCPRCGKNLKLVSDHIKYLVARYIE